MFTGLVEEVGEVASLKKSSKGAYLTVKCSKVLEGTKVGDSVAVNGACLTVVEVGKENLSFFVSLETLNRTNLKFLRSGSPVNLERALRLGDRLGGHLLLGHVDATTKITAVKREGESFLFKFQLPKRFSHLVVEKGSVGIDGISLTVANLTADSFQVAVIPHTLKETNLKFRKAGDLVNVEFDVIGKFVERMVRKAP
jgi:riboflavin synthase